MAKSLGRYKCADAVGSRAVPVRDGHVTGWARPTAARVRDQDPEEEPEGALICRVMQTGTDTWAGHDARGRVLRIRRGQDGALEIRHIAEATQDEADPGVVGTNPEADPDVVGTNPEADPDVVGTNPGTGGDPATAATGDSALAEWQRTGSSRFHMRGLAEYQRRLDEHYAR
jgi:hypothetical protein